MPVRKRRNIETEKYVARRQAANMGGIDSEDLLKLIDAKGGDYYRGDLIPTPEGQSAYNNIGMTQSNSPMFALQQDILEEMRGYYGLNTPTKAAVVPAPVAAPVSRAAAPTEIQEPFPIQTTVPREPAVKVDDPYVTTTVPKQEVPSPAAEEIKDSYINKILGYNVKDIYDQIKNTKGLFTDSALTEAAITGGSVLGLTGIAGLGGADGGDAAAYGLLGAGTAAAPAIFNAVRNPAYRTPMRSGRGLVGAVAAGAGMGTGTSLLMDALGLTNQG